MLLLKAHHNFWQINHGKYVDDGGGNIGEDDRIDDLMGGER